MLMSHGLFVLAVDGARMKLLRNRGNELTPALELVEEADIGHPAGHVPGASEPGRTFDNPEPARHAYAVDDRHEGRQQDFGVAALDRLQSWLLPDTPAVLVAPPAMLGKLRKAMKPDLRRHVVAQFDSDLAHRDVREIAAFLSAPGF